jgi:hypothetical protein
LFDAARILSNSAHAICSLTSAILIMRGNQMHFVIAAGPPPKLSDPILKKLIKSGQLVLDIIFSEKIADH